MDPRNPKGPSPCMGVPCKGDDWYIWASFDSMSNLEIIWNDIRGQFMSHPWGGKYVGSWICHMRMKLKTCHSWRWSKWKYYWQTLWWGHTLSGCIKLTGSMNTRCFPQRISVSLLLQNKIYLNLLRGKKRGFILWADKNCLFTIPNW